MLLPCTAYSIFINLIGLLHVLGVIIFLKLNLPHCGNPELNYFVFHDVTQCPVSSSITQEARVQVPATINRYNIALSTLSCARILFSLLPLQRSDKSNGFLEQVEVDYQ